MSSTGRTPFLSDLKAMTDSIEDQNSAHSSTVGTALFDEGKWTQAQN